MKRRLKLALLCLLFSGAAAEAAHLGPAQPLTNRGEFSLGSGFFYYSAEWDGDVDATQSLAYVQAGYGILPNTEVYVQLGGANLEIDDSEFEDGYRPFGTVGVKAMLLERDPVSMGAFLQGSYFADYEDETPGGELSVESSYEINGGLALQTVLEGATLYGGPLFYIHEGDVSLAGRSGSFEEQGNLGGFIGIRWPLKNRMAIDLETHLKTGVSVGGAFHYIF